MVYNQDQHDLININPRGLTTEEKLKLDLDIYLRFPYINLKEIGS